MHGDWLDHRHLDDGEIEYLQRSHPLWRTDRIELRSVGIDIGSSTSHLIFSALVMRRQSAALSSRFELAERRIEHKSSILLTPFVNGASLDLPALSSFIEEAYAESGWDVQSIDTGAVITTGDAARKDNAEAVVQLLSDHAGKFVCASAGPFLEAKMSAYGSGAVARSATGEHGATVLNIDIGGGTSKFALTRGGKILEATAMNVGARLVTFDERDLVTKIENAGGIAAAHCGVVVEIGQPISLEVRRTLAAALIEALLEVATGQGATGLAAKLLIGSPLKREDSLDIVQLSGGVSEYFYHSDVPHFGDLGPLMAEHLKGRLADSVAPATVEAPVQGIRATVIGASQFTAQVSGNTIYIGSPQLLPLKSLKVVTIKLEEADLTTAGIARAVQRSMEHAEVDAAGGPIALALQWPYSPAYRGLEALAEGVLNAMDPLVVAGFPIVLTIDSDTACLIGYLMAERAKRPTGIICIDGIDLHEFDYIDISAQHQESGVVTIIVKSLIFTG